MLEQLPDGIQSEAEAIIRSKASESRVLDVYATAEEICRKYADRDIRVEDVAAMVARLGNQYGCAVEFGHPQPEAREAASA